MSKKKSFVLRIDEATYAALVRWANDDFRSVNGQHNTRTTEKSKKIA